MDDYLRKAVELADGWKRRSGMNLETGSIWLIQGPDKYLTCLFSEPKQYLLDALAAQLVRQVDATQGRDKRHHRFYDSDEYGTAKIWTPNGNRKSRIEKANGPDRTMNTIKAIVDSGVLLTGGSDRGN